MNTEDNPTIEERNAAMETYCHISLVVGESSKDCPTFVRSLRRTALSTLRNYETFLDMEGINTLEYAPLVSGLRTMVREGFDEILEGMAA